MRNSRNILVIFLITLCVLVVVWPLFAEYGEYGDRGDFSARDDILLISDEEEVAWYNLDADLDANTVSIRTLNENNAMLREAYARIWNDIRWPDWIYFTSQQKKWRLGPVGDHLEAQWFTGDNILNDWRNDALWAMQWRSYGGADV